MLGQSDIEVKNVVRLGKTNSDNTKPRPLKVTLKNKEDVQKVMANLTKLKDAEEKFRRISVTKDLTQEERAQIKQKVEEARQKEKNESEGGLWTFKVRGPPWNLRIIRMKKTQK